jgi:hypothetical protein
MNDICQKAVAWTRQLDGYIYSEAVSVYVPYKLVIPVTFKAYRTASTIRKCKIYGVIDSPHSEDSGTVASFREQEQFFEDSWIMDTESSCL